MTIEEKTKKSLRKETINKKLSELQRKISVCADMLSKARKCQKLLKAEYEELDRELFEATQGVTVIKTKKKKVKEPAAAIFVSYEKMSLEDQESALARLLEIQTNMTQKTQS